MKTISSCLEEQNGRIEMAVKESGIAAKSRLRTTVHQLQPAVVSRTAPSG